MAAKIMRKTLSPPLALFKEYIRKLVLWRAASRKMNYWDRTAELLHALVSKPHVLKLP